MSMKTILVIEDDADVLSLIEYNFKQAGFAVQTAEDGEVGLRLAQKSIPDLIILDLMLPQMDGREVCRQLKQKESTRSISVLMLTGLAAEADRIVGLELGADDYVTKPFSPRELVLRVQAILRRNQPADSTHEVLSVGEISIYPQQHRVDVEGVTVPLTTMEFRLLNYLAGNAGKVQTRELILENVWGHRHNYSSRTVDTHIRRLRSKLGRAGSYIDTVRSIGYRFRDEQ